MRSAAKVFEIILFIDGDGFARYHVEDRLFEMIFREFRARFFFTDLVTGDRVLLFCEVQHLFFDALQVPLADLFFDLEIVIKTVFNDGPDVELRIRVKFLDRLRHEVRGGVADDVERFGAVAVDDRLAADPVGFRGLKVDDLVIVFECYGIHQLSFPQPDIKHAKNKFRDSSAFSYGSSLKDFGKTQ